MGAWSAVVEWSARRFDEVAMYISDLEQHRLASAGDPPQLTRLVVAIETPQWQSCARSVVLIELRRVTIPIVPKWEKRLNAMFSVGSDHRDTLSPF